MSTIFEINLPSLDNYAFKRMPIFRSTEEIDDYQILYREYNRLIHEDIDVRIPESTSVRVIPNEGNMVLYIVQRKLPAQSICDRVIKDLDDRSVGDLVVLVLREMKKVFEFNASGGNITIGFDGQISNWAIKDYDGSGPPRIDGNTQFYYIDTGTPLMSDGGSGEAESRSLSAQRSFIYGVDHQMAFSRRCYDALLRFSPRSG